MAVLWTSGQGFAKTSNRVVTQKEVEFRVRWEEKYGEDALERYWDEWMCSAIDPELTYLNLIPIGTSQQEQWQLASTLVPDPEETFNRKTPPAQWAGIEKNLRKSWRWGGWYCEAIEPITGEPMGLLAANKSPGEPRAAYSSYYGWGCFKPKNPRTGTKSSGKTRTIKYEQPHKCMTRVFFLRVPVSVWKKIVKANGYPEPDYTKNFWDWVLDNPVVELWITEGAKKAAALLSAGKVAIALPGIYNGYQKDDEGNRCLHSDLAGITSGRESVVICFDNENKIKKPEAWKNVNLATKRLGELIEAKMNDYLEEEEGVEPYHLKIAQIPAGGDKGIDDFLFNQKEEEFTKLSDNAVKLLNFKLSESFDGLHSLQSVDPVRDELRHERWLKPLKFGDAKLLMVKSGTNTGKTKQIEKLVEDHIAKGGKVLVITHRVQLAEHLCDRFDIHYVRSEEDECKRNLVGVGLCIDSLHSKSIARIAHNSIKEEHNVLVIFDECEQVLHHLVNSTTAVQDNRPEIIYNLTSILLTAFKSNFGGVIASDANLTEVSKEFFRDIGGKDLKIKTVINTYKSCEGKRNAYIYRNEAQIYREIVKSLEECVARKEKGVKQRTIAIYTHSQKRKSQLSAKNLRRVLRKKFPQLKYTVADAQTVVDPKSEAKGLAADPNSLFQHHDPSMRKAGLELLARHGYGTKLSQWGKEFDLGLDKLLGLDAQLNLFDTQASREKELQEKLKAFEKEISQLIDFTEPEQVDVFLFTPVIETGVSIDIKDVFWKQFGILQGVNAPTNARQGISRVRADCDRFIYCPKYGLSHVGNKYLTNKEAVINNLSLKLQATLRSTHWNGEDLTEQQIIEHHKRQNAALNLFGKMGARTNQESELYYDYLVEGLRGEGYEIIEVDPEALPAPLKQSYNQELKINKLESHQEEIDLTMEQQPFASDLDYQNSKKREEKTEEERLREKKHEVLNKYAVPVTEAILRAEDDGFYRKLKNLYYLQEAEEEGREKDKRHLRFKLEKAKDFGIFSPDLQASTTSSRIKILEGLGIKKLLGNLPEVGQLLEEQESILNQVKLKKKQVSTSLEETNRLKLELGSLKDKTSIAERQKLRGEIKSLFKKAEGVKQSLVEFCYTNNSPVLQNLRSTALNYRKGILTQLGIALPVQIALKEDGVVVGYRDSTPIEVLQPLLKGLGLKLNCVARLGSRENRERFYAVTYQHLNHDTIREIFGEWQLKEAQRKLEAGEQQMNPYEGFVHQKVAI